MAGRPSSDRGGQGREGRQGDDRSRGRPGQANRGHRPRQPRPDQPRSDQSRSDAARQPSSSSLSRPRRVEPPLPEDVTGRELDRAVRAELASLSALNGDAVARHLVMAGRLLDDDPEAAYQHAMAAQRRAARVGAVREAAGLAAYATGRYAEALSELRAARRITGDASNLPVMADCERGLSRPERALELAAAPDVARLDAAGKVEMLIVVSGARRDLGQPRAAVLALQGPQLKPSLRRPWSARLFYAYADALLGAGRADEARAWFGHAAAADEAGETDASLRLALLEGRDPEGPADPEIIPEIIIEIDGTDDADG